MEIASPSAMDRDSQLFATLYDELRRLADSQLKAAGRDLTLSPMTVIHETWLDRSSRPDLQFADRAHFMAYAARAMSTAAFLINVLQILTFENKCSLTRCTGNRITGDDNMSTNDLSSAIEQSHAALDAILKGDPSGYKALFSDADDVTLGNPFGPYARGRQNVEATLSKAALNFSDGGATDVELVEKYISDSLACVVEVERGRARLGGGKNVVPVAVRVTSVFRLESGNWKLVHRHADPIMTQRPAESLAGK